MRTPPYLARRGAFLIAAGLLAAVGATAPALASATGTTTLTARDGADFDAFGQTDAISSNGNVAIVGAPAHGGTGAAYIFTRHGTGFTQTAKLTPPSSADSDFGAVAIASQGRTVVVGAAAANNLAGAAFVYSDASGSWKRIATFTAPGTVNFGAAVSISADASTIVVGSPFNGKDDTGAAYVFTRSGSTYTQAQKLTPAASGLALFGDSTAVSTNGSTIAIGASLASDQAGYVDVFTRSGSTWTRKAQLTGQNTAAGDNFGDSVTVSGNGKTVAVGSPGSNGGHGSGYVFTRANRTFTQVSQVLPPAADTGGGSSVGISASGSVIAIGGGQVNSDTGAVYVATKGSGGYTVTATETEPSAGFGLGVTPGSTAVAGNGASLISADRQFDGTGAAFVFPLG